MCRGASHHRVVTHSIIERCSCRRRRGHGGATRRIVADVEIDEPFPRSDDFRSKPSSRALH